MQALDLTDSDLGSLPPAIFSGSGLLHLQRLGLRRAGITEFHRDTFKDLRILVELDLSENLIREIPNNALLGNDRLRMLALNENPITSLIEEQFPALPHLRTLELRGCQISSVHPRAFINLSPLETIDLRDNLLTVLVEVTFFPLISLKMLLLDGNPWTCDCNLRSFRNWYLSSRLKSEDQICVEPPEFKDVTWENMNSTSFVCMPSIKIFEATDRAVLGTNVTIACLALGDPIPKVLWKFDDIPLSNLDLDIILEEGNGWNNITLINITRSANGEYTCLAESEAGKDKGSVNIILPDSSEEGGTARASEGEADKAETGRIILGLLIGGVASLSAIILAIIGVWRARSERIANSRSFTDQERKLLESSYSGEIDRTDADRLELREYRGISGKKDGLGVATMDSRSPPLHISVEPILPLFPPPPEFCALPNHGCGNIYISVQVASGTRPPRVPDLLGGGTLPRRSPRRIPLSVPAAPRPPLATLHAATLTSTYDNMGPRRTVTGSSSWSLTDIMPPPPPEYVSL